MRRRMLGVAATIVALLTTPLGQARPGDHPGRPHLWFNLPIGTDMTFGTGEDHFEYYFEEPTAGVLNTNLADFDFAGANWVLVVQVWAPQAVANGDWAWYADHGWTYGPDLLGLNDFAMEIETAGTSRVQVHWYSDTFSSGAFVVHAKFTPR